MFDHGGVLDGSIVTDKSTITANDLVLDVYDEGLFQVLKNGVQIVKYINDLVAHHGYEVVFHSKNKEEDQIKILNQLQLACTRKGLEFPKIRAMAVYDVSQYQNRTSADPKKITNQQGIAVAGWGADDLSGKASVRRALETLLEIDPKDRKNHIVFDDGAPNVSTPRGEGYQAHLIGIGEGCVALDKALEQILLSEQNQDTPQEIKIEIQAPVVEALCNQFLSIVLKENSPTPPMSIYLDERKSKPNSICLGQRFEATIIGKYLPELDKLKHIFEKLGLLQVEKETLPGECWRYLNIPYNEMVKISPFCNWEYAKKQGCQYGELPDSQLQRVKILCAHYLGHTWEVRQGSLQPFSEEELSAKEKVVRQLYYAGTIEQVKTILSDNQKFLNTHRTHWSILLLEALAVIVTLPLSVPALLIYSSVTRGSCNFFKPDSELLSDKISLELSQEPSNKI